MSGNVRIVGLGVDQRGAGRAFREKLAATWDAGVGDVVTGGTRSTGVALCTCLRLEAYIAADDPVRCAEAVVRGVSGRAGIAPDRIETRLAVRTGRAAVHHLFSVAAGLESMIVGERQILDQIRDTWQRSGTAGPLDPHVDRLFQHAVGVGKRVRRETGIGRGGRSVGDIAADLAARNVGDLGAATVTIVGAGAVARAAAVSLGRRGARTFAILNRSPSGGEALAADLERRGWGCVAMPWDRLAQAVAAADVIVCATSAPGRVLRARDLPDGRRRVVVDLAQPRDVEPSVARLPAAALIDLHAIWRHAAGSAGTAPVDIAMARALVDSGVDSYVRWTAEREAAPDIAALMGHRARAKPALEARRALHNRTMALKRRALQRAGVVV